MITKIKYLLEIGKNILSNSKYQLSYIIERKDWSIKWDGYYITENLNKLNLLKSRVAKSHLGIKNQIVHFGSISTFLKKNGFQKPDKSNKTVLTWFHFVPEEKRNKNIIEAQRYLDIIHTSCNITKNKLIELGVDSKKIIIIPLGVDLSQFKPVAHEEKGEIRKKLGIPLDKIIIGSFQKDGVGWGKGLTPKLIKGPDIFVEVVARLSKYYSVFVLLVGPARGYIKSNLEKRGIPYKDIGYLRNPSQIAKYYNALDLYLITSRIEGGPKQILEAMASGIPVVSTKIGMVPDIVEDDKEALLVESENIEELVEKSKKIIGDKGLREKLIENGLKTVQDYSWTEIARRYYEEIYSKLS